MARDVISTCPVCANELTITRLHCRGCGTSLEGEFGVGKPEESVYRHVLRALGAAPAEAWMVGDHLEWDVGAPQRLGLTGVWIDRGGLGLPPGSAVRPHRIIRSLVELCASGE